MNAGCLKADAGPGAPLLVLFLFVGEVISFYVLDVLSDGAGYLTMEAQVATEEAGLEFCGNAKEVVHDEDLPVTVFAGSDTDDRDVEALGDGLGKGGGDLFEYDA